MKAEDVQMEPVVEGLARAEARVVEHLTQSLHNLSLGLITSRVSERSAEQPRKYLTPRS